MITSEDRRFYSCLKMEKNGFNKGRTKERYIHKFHFSLSDRWFDLCSESQDHVL